MIKRLFLLLVFTCFLFIAKSQVKQSFACDSLGYSNDEMRDLKEYYTPIDIKAPTMFYINKIIELKKPARYYIHIRIAEPLGKYVKGAFILLKNGKKIARPLESIDVDVDPAEQSISHPGYRQSVALQLTAADILLLKSSPISKFKISYLETEDLENSEAIYQMFLCMLTKK